MSAAGDPLLDDPFADAHVGGLARLRDWRVWALEQWENESLSEQHAPDGLVLAQEQMGSVQLALGALDPEPLDGDELMATALSLEGIQRRLDAAKASTFERLEATGVTYAKAGLSPKQWKASRTHGAPATGARELTLARTLARFGSFADALGAGHLGAEHVLALANACNPRVIDALVELEGDLVRFARQHHFAVFKRHLRYLVALLDQDGAEPDCGDRDTARMAALDDGHLHLVVDLSGHHATTAQRIITEETDRQYRAAVSEHAATGVPVPSLPVLRARAVHELLRRGVKANPDSPKPAVEAIVPITVDRDGVPTGAHSIDGEQLDTVTAAVLICDAHLKPVVVDSSGNPLDLGRTRRFFTQDQRDALIVRDGGCVFPGCERPASQCDAHHRNPWGLGGTTDVSEGALLCRRHHGMVHSHDPWAMRNLTIDDLPQHLRDQHHARSSSAGLDPSPEVVVWTTPGGRMLLAQNAIDHRGPAPPRIPAA